MKTMKNFFKTKSGMTLIEVIVAIAILALVTLTLFSMYSTGLFAVSRSGANSDKQYQTIGFLENQIIGNIGVVPENITSSSTPDVSLTIYFNETAVSVSGSTEKVVFSDGDYEMTVSTFVPYDN